MAAIVASDLVTVGLGNETSYPPDSTFSYSGTAGNVLIVAVHGADRTNAGGISDVTCEVDGVEMTPLAGAIHSNGDGHPLVRLFASTGLSAGSKSVTAFFRGRACTVFAMEVSGLDDSDLVANSSVIESTSSTYSHSYTPTASGNFLISFLATRGGTSGSFSPDAGMTEELDTYTGTTNVSDVGSWVGYRDAPGTSAIDVGATPTINDDLVFGVVEFNTAGGGGSTSVAPADSAQTTSATSPAVTSVAVVAPNDGVHASAATEPAASSSSGVSPADAAHSVASTQPALSSLAIVSPDDAVNDNTATSPVVSQPGVVSPNDATHAVSSASSSASPAVASFLDDGLEPLADAVPIKKRKESSPRETIENIMRPPAVVVREDSAEIPAVQEAAKRQQEFEEEIAALRVKLERARAKGRIESIQAQIIEIEERAEAERIAQLQWVEDEAAALLLLAAA